MYRKTIFKRRAIPVHAFHLFIVVGLSGLLAVLLSAALPVHAAAIMVNTTADENNNDGDCSLREAIRAANLDMAVDACPAGNGADTIHLPAGTYVLTLGSRNENEAQGGDLDIKGDLAILGAGQGNTVIDAAGLDGVFDIHSGTVELFAMTITGGDPGSPSGGGIRVNQATLIANSSRIGDNIDRGGIYIDEGGVATLIDTHVDSNHSDISSGGIGNDGTLYLKNSLVSGNTAANNGGGISNYGTMLLVNSTISGNSANIHGGGILNIGSAQIINTTITANTADADSNDVGHGGGVYNTPGGNPGTFQIRNSIIGGNFDNSANSIWPDCSGTLISEGYNLIEIVTGCVITGDTTGNKLNVAPELGPLTNNGGPTMTHALLARSPAIDAGAPVGCLDEEGEPLTADQRGYVRLMDGDSDNKPICDMGAFEYLSKVLPTATPSPTPTSSSTPKFTSTPTSTSTATATPTSTSGPSPTPTHTATVGPSPTATQTASPTATPTDGPSPTPTETATPTATATDGPSPTPTDTSTPGPSPTPTETAMPGPSPTPTETATPGPSPTATTPFVPSYWLYLPVNLDE